jgi:hypothetical protein
MQGSDHLQESWLESAVARRCGFKASRDVSFREDVITENELRDNPAVHGSLASILIAGFKTCADTKGLPMLLGPDGETVYEFADGIFHKSSAQYKGVDVIRWGCIAPIFSNLLPEPQEQSYGSYGTYTAINGRISFEALKDDDLEYFRDELVGTTECVELMMNDDDNNIVHFMADDDDDDSVPFFNETLSDPISIGDLQHSFRMVFPSDEEIQEANEIEEAKREKLTKHAAERETVKDRATTIGKIVISYRHQEYSANRISEDDWLCACHSLRLVMQALGWEKARFWTDARLRLKRASSSSSQGQNDMDWAVQGLEPYTMGPIVVLNLARRPSITDRFWLTLERKSGMQYYGTWLTDDAGDTICYKHDNPDLFLYERAMVTAVSTSQGITFKTDRLLILKHAWECLEVETIDKALDLLRDESTLEARADVFDEDMHQDVILNDEVVPWCGDIEAYADPPSLIESFGPINLSCCTNHLPIQAVETDIFVQNLRVVVVQMKLNTQWFAKRIYLDTDGAIRARTVPRLVDEDYATHLLEVGPAREVDLKEAPWYKLVSGEEESA